MVEKYTREVSKHYAAYRPPIHKMILECVLPAESRYQCGVDIGCGTGVSTIALSNHCQFVYGVEPSKDMLNNVVSSENVCYLQGTGEATGLEASSADVVTFAGSLFYAKSDLLVDEITRICRPEANVLVYDFEVVLSDVMLELGINMSSSSSGYDHAINFSDYDEFEALNIHKTSLSMNVNSEQLAHILFSSLRRYTRFIEYFGSKNTFSLVVNLLNKASNQHAMSVDVYYSMYRVNQA